MGLYILCSIIYIRFISQTSDFGSFPPSAHILLCWTSARILSTLLHYTTYIYIPIHDNIIHTGSSVRGSVQCSRHTFGVSVFARVCDTCPRGDRMNAMIRSGVNFSTFLGGLRRAIKRVCQSVSLVVKICIYGYVYVCTRMKIICSTTKK